MGTTCVLAALQKIERGFCHAMDSEMILASDEEVEPLFNAMQ